MAEEGKRAYADFRSLRDDIKKLLPAGRIRYNLRQIKRKGHVEMSQGIINATLLHGAYRHDKDHQASQDRFNALADYRGSRYKVVFEVWEGDEGALIVVITAYEVDNNE